MHIMTNENSLAIHVQDVDFTYITPGRPDHHTLKQINLSADENEFIGLIGPSGCGKTTLLKILCGLYPPDSGLVTVKGLPPIEARKKGRFSVVFQSPALLEWRTIGDNILLPIELHSPIISQHRDHARELIDLVGLSKYSMRYPRELSGGMQQRVAIARALINNPSVLLMDEPFGALDQITRGKLNHELQRLWMEFKPSVLFITHSIREACFLSDKIAVMSNSPGSIRRVYKVNFKRPRTFDLFHNIEFISLEREVSEALGNMSIA